MKVGYYKDANRATVMMHNAQCKRDSKYKVTDIFQRNKTTTYEGFALTIDVLVYLESEVFTVTLRQFDTSRHSHINLFLH